MSSEERPAPKSEDARCADLVELTPPRQVAAGALGAREEGGRPAGVPPGRPGPPPAAGRHRRGRPARVRATRSSIGSTVSGLLDQLGGSSDQVAGVLKHRWAELVGPEIAEHCEYVSF